MNELVAFYRVEFSQYKMPKIIKLVEDLPKEPSGKVPRLKLLKFLHTGGAQM